MAGAYDEPAVRAAIIAETRKETCLDCDHLVAECVCMVECVECGTFVPSRGTLDCACWGAS